MTSVVALVSAGDNFSASVLGHGIFRLAEHDVWEGVGQGLPNGLMVSLVGIDSRLFVSIYREGVFRIRQGEERWQLINIDRSPAIATVLVEGGGYLYAIKADGRIHRTRDFGETWEERRFEAGSKKILAFAADSLNMFVGTAKGCVYRSVKDGKEWIESKVATDASQITTLLLCDGILYAGTKREGVFRSNDRGATWISVNKDLWWRKIDLLSAEGGTVYTVLPPNHVMRSTDRGASWESVGEQVGDGTTDVWCLAVHRGNLYAGTAKQGVFAYSKQKGIWLPLNTALPSGLNMAVIEALVKPQAWVTKKDGSVIWGQPQGLVVLKSEAEKSKDGTKTMYSVVYYLINGGDIAGIDGVGVSTLEGRTIGTLVAMQDNRPPNDVDVLVGMERKKDERMFRSPSGALCVAAGKEFEGEAINAKLIGEFRHEGKQGRMLSAIQVVTDKGVISLPVKDVVAFRKIRQSEKR
jgi:ligand-binding sensor domain-containing protein